jgi:hypothetical protein
MGTIGLLTFVTTGAYMRHIRTGEFSDAVHMLYRSRHIYILGAALANLALANVALQPRVLDRIISAMVLVAPPVLLAAFIIEPSIGPDTGRGWAVWGQYALFVAAALLLIRAWRGR